MGEAAMWCLGLYPEPSLPRKPMAGKGSLRERWNGDQHWGFGLIAQGREGTERKEGGKGRGREKRERGGKLTCAWTRLPKTPSRF